MTEAETETVICYKCRDEFEASKEQYEKGFVLCPKCQTWNEVILG